jgi:predicted CXXCH cytochrome family protein
MFKMRHLVRAGILLAILLASLFALKRVTVPSTSVQGLLAQYDVVLSGTNKEATTREWASQPVQYLGLPDCGECHPDQFIQWSRSKHYVVSCEGCHGPAQAHLRKGAKLVVETSPDFCKTCHGKLFSRPGNFPQIDNQSHSEEWTCVSCHNPHHPEGLLQAQTEGATAPEIAHSVEDRGDCLACHGAGGIVAFPEGHAGRTNELCLGCHVPLTAPPEASQTPILVSLTNSFPRIPHRLQGRSNCLLCHDPEGLLPSPKDHTGRTNDMCRTCHKSK